MNENEIKNEKTTGSMPPAENVTVYNDLEIFDFDAHRKAKAEAAQAQVKAQVKAQTPKTTPVNAPNTPSTAPRTHSATAAKPSVSPNTVKASPKNNNTPPRSQITDVQPEKVVFDASSGSRRTPKALNIAGKKEKKQKTIKPREEKTRGSNPLTVLAKALIYIAFVLLVSGLCAYFIIVVANDVFAFVKAEAQVEVVIPEYATLDQIADELHEKQIIKYPKIFVLYTMIRGNDPGKYVAGVYTVSPTQNYDELLSTFVEKKSYSMTEISVTIPEGYTVDDIITLLVDEKGIGTREGFIDAIQNGEYDYWFIQELTDLDPDRKYRLEGYLYPDTYYFYQEWEEEKVINKILANFYSKFSIQYKQECEKAGMSIDDVVNLASIIQMEAKYSTDYSLVSSVIHNRLNSAYYNYRLDCDATIQYFLPERKEDLTHEDTLIDNPYNSYQNSGLPPGPISNPTLKAIRAALYPEQTSTPYYFFVSDIDGQMLYARNLPEHNANIAKVEANAAAAKAAAGGN